MRQNVRRSLAVKKVFDALCASIKIYESIFLVCGKSQAHPILRRIPPGCQWKIDLLLTLHLALFLKCEAY